MLMKGSSRVSRKNVCEMADLTESPAAFRILGKDVIAQLKLALARLRCTHDMLAFGPTSQMLRRIPS